ncbi:DNA-binding response regulator, partial [Enterococcus hirae]
MRILLAEDDAETGAYIVKGLSGEGHVVDHLTDGKDTLSQAMTGDYELLILDRMMPGLDGLS